MSAKPPAVPIFKGRDFYVPAFEVKIGPAGSPGAGKPLPKETLRDIMEVRYVDTVGQFDTFELTVNNWDALKRDFKYTGPAKGTSDPTRREQLFDPGQEVELWMGYFKPPKGGQGALRLMLTGVITKVAPSFPAAGVPTLKVSGVNSLARLIKKQETHVYKEKLRDSDIAMEVDKRGNLTFNNVKIPVETNKEARAKEPEHPDKVTQKNQYDVLFLLQLAHRNGYDLVLRGEEKNGQYKQSLYFGPSTQKPPQTFLVEWGKSLVQFNPTMKTMKQVNELTVCGWDAMKKEEIKVTVSRKDLDTKGLKDEERLYRIEQGFSEKAEVVVDRPFRNAAEAKTFALGQLSDISKNLVTTHGSTLGTTGIRAGQKIEVQGVGRTFNGPYFITSSTHVIGAGGYLTEFDARLEVPK